MILGCWLAVKSGRTAKFYAVRPDAVFVYVCVSVIYEDVTWLICNKIRSSAGIWLTLRLYWELNGWIWRLMAVSGG